VRLSEEHARAIARSTREVFGDQAVVRLFGSRVDDSRRGGDIDLHLEIPDREDLRNAKYDFLRRLYKELGERQIDVVIHRKGTPWKLIDEIAMKTGIVL
jgi:predicted nucleotidyltransferase